MSGQAAGGKRSPPPPLSSDRQSAIAAVAAALLFGVACAADVAAGRVALGLAHGALVLFWVRYAFWVLSLEGTS